MNAPDINKKFIINTNFIISLIVQLYIAQISNYRFSSFVLKFFALTLSFSFLMISLKFYQIPLKTIIKKINPNFKIILTCFILFPLITLIYSSNPSFGFIKWINLIIGLIPSILLFYFAFILIEKIEIKFIYEILISISLFVLMLIFFIKPFTYSGNYNPVNLEFSHVLSGRFFGPITLIAFYLILITEEKKKLFFYTLSGFIFFIGIFYISHRTTIIGIIIILPILFLTAMQRLKIKNVNKILFCLSYFLSIIISLNFNILNQRNYELINYIMNNDTKDSSITTRYEIYKTTVERIIENPLLGVGFGGFNSYYKTNLPILLKYPHNLFLETQIELGITGTILLLYLLYMILKSTYKKSALIFCLVILALWLAMTSKDITTQNLLFINIVFISYKN